MEHCTENLTYSNYYELSSERFKEVSWQDTVGENNINEPKRRKIILSLTHFLLFYNIAIAKLFFSLFLSIYSNYKKIFLFSWPCFNFMSSLFWIKYQKHYWWIYHIINIVFLLDPYASDSDPPDKCDESESLILTIN